MLHTCVHSGVQAAPAKHWHACRYFFDIPMADIEAVFPGALCQLPICQSGSTQTQHHGQEHAQHSISAACAHQQLCRRKHSRWTGVLLAAPIQPINPVQPIILVQSIR